MIPTAALPFELPSMPAQGAGVPPMQDSPTGFARSDDSEGTFDSILLANSATIPAPESGRSGPVMASRPSQEEPQAALIVPAKFRDRVPMPASLVAKASAETMDASTEPSGRLQACDESSVETETAEGVAKEAVLEWVAAGNVPWPSKQPMPELINARPNSAGTGLNVPSPTGQATTDNAAASTGTATGSQTFSRPTPKTVPTWRDRVPFPGPVALVTPPAPSASSQAAAAVQSALPPHAAPPASPLKPDGAPAILPSQAGAIEDAVVLSAEITGPDEVGLPPSAPLGNGQPAAAKDMRRDVAEASARSERAVRIQEASPGEIPRSYRSLQAPSSPDPSVENIRDPARLPFTAGLVEGVEQESSAGTAQASSGARSTRPQTPQTTRRPSGVAEPLEAWVEGKTSSGPTVFVREIVVSGRRFDAKSMGEYPTAEPAREAVAEVAPPSVPAAVAPALGASSFDGPVVPASAFQTATGLQAVEILKSLFHVGGRALSFPPGETSSLSSRSGDAPVQTPVPVSAPGSTTAPAAEISSKPEALLKVVEDRLRAEGIATTGPVSIRILKSPTRSDPGEFKVRAEGREVALSGWWDQAGRMAALPSDQTRLELQTRPDGKIQPGAPGIPAAVPQSRSTSPTAVQIAVENIGSPVNQMVSTGSPAAAASRIVNLSSGGISSARQALTMRSSNDQAEFAGSAGTRSMGGLGRNPEAKASRPVDLLTELAAMPFVEKFSRTEAQPANPGTPLERIVQSDRIDRMDAVERLRSVIHHEMAVLKASGGDSLAVVVRPTADSEIFIQLTREKGGVEAFVRMEKGDAAELRRQWAHLEGALAEQQVRLQPLQAGSSTTDDPGFHDRRNQFSRQQEQQGGEQSGAKHSFNGEQPRGGFRQDDPRRAHLSPDMEPPAPKVPAPRAPGSPPRGGGHNRNFDNWA